jgi:hypothetical protein
MPFMEAIPGISPYVNFTNSYFDNLISSGEDIVNPSLLPDRDSFVE